MSAKPFWPIVTAEDVQTAQEVTPNEPVARETGVATLQKPVAVSGPAVSTEVIASTDEVVQLPPSYSWGSPQGGNWTATGADDKVNVGDVMRFTQRLKIPFLQQWQTDYAIGKFQDDQRFQLLYFALNEETRTLVIEARATASFSPVPLIAAAVVIILAGAFIWTTTLAIERLGTVSVGNTKISVTPLIVFGILGVVALGFLHHRKT